MFVYVSIIQDQCAVLQRERHKVNRDQNPSNALSIKLSRQKRKSKPQRKRNGQSETHVPCSNVVCAHLGLPVHVTTTVSTSQPTHFIIASSYLPNGFQHAYSQANMRPIRFPRSATPHGASCSRICSLDARDEILQLLDLGGPAVETRYAYLPTVGAAWRWWAARVGCEAIRQGRELIEHDVPCGDFQRCCERLERKFCNKV